MKNEGIMQGHGKGAQGKEWVLAGPVLCILGDENPDSGTRPLGLSPDHAVFRSS